MCWWALLLLLGSQLKGRYSEIVILLSDCLKKWFQDKKTKLRYIWTGGICYNCCKKEERKLLNFPGELCKSQSPVYAFWYPLFIWCPTFFLSPNCVCSFFFPYAAFQTWLFFFWHTAATYTVHKTARRTLETWLTSMSYLQKDQKTAEPKQRQLGKSLVAEWLRRPCLVFINSLFLG